MNPEMIVQRFVPARLKVYAPNGDTREAKAALCIRSNPRYSQLTELFLYYEDKKVEVLNKKVVVKNLDTGEVCYDPRSAPTHFEGRTFLTGSVMAWLKRNPHWPAILELWDNPVETGTS